MSRSLAFILIFLAGWTLASNLVILSGGSLETLMLAGPGCMALLCAVFFFLPGNRTTLAPAGDLSPSDPARPQTKLFVLLAMAACVLLSINWYGFWALSVAILTLHCLIASRHESAALSVAPVIGRADHWVIFLTMLCAAGLALAINRGDADDAFYVGVAAFTHKHPYAPLLAVDPMHGEPSWPLLFPSYRFASYELLAAALAKLFGMAAMDVMYRVLPPLGAAFVIASTFFLCRQLAPHRWLLVGLVAVALGLVLGENHRSIGNFMFVRIFQGKSIYVSALMPLIFALTFRCSSQEGNARDVMLLACAQLAAIGLSNFGMLAAPMAAGTALVASALTAPRERYPRLAAMACTLLIPLPYLLYVAMAAHGGGDLPSAEEPAPAVWVGVFGSRQQYAVALLLLTAPALARDSRTRAWLAVPPLILLGVLLNPWLDHFISQDITTAPVYWRVTWCFPIFIYMAWSIYAIGRELRLSSTHFLLGAMTATLLAWSLEFSVLRAGNGVSWHLAGRQIPAADYSAAKQTLKLAENKARILAPEPVSSVIARFEDHPRLALVRDMYLPMLQASVGEATMAQRLRLRDFVNGSFQERDTTAIFSALRELDVGTVVTNAGESPTNRLLTTDDYTLIDTVGPYAIWRRTQAPPSS